MIMLLDRKVSYCQQLMKINMAFDEIYMQDGGNGDMPAAPAEEEKEIDMPEMPAEEGQDASEGEENQ